MSGEHFRFCPRVSVIIIIMTMTLFTVVVSGCGTLPNKRGWGQDTTLSPGWERVGRAAWSSTIHPATWGPAAAALAFRIAGDRDLSDWAANRNPVFGSKKNAEQWSDDLLTVSEIAWAASSMAIPSGDTPGEWAINKAKGVGMQAGAAAGLRGIVGFVKNTTDRKEPNGLNDDALPSGHITLATYFYTLSYRNAKTAGLPEAATNASGIALGGLAVLTAWSRVESDFHFPSDALASIALGHFFGSFITDAFIVPDNPGRMSFLLTPLRRGATALVRYDF